MVDRSVKPRFRTYLVEKINYVIIAGSTYKEVLFEFVRLCDWEDKDTT